jgi:hypothetical protein
MNGQYLHSIARGVLRTIPSVGIIPWSFGIQELNEPAMQVHEIKIKVDLFKVGDDLAESAQLTQNRVSSFC